MGDQDEVAGISEPERTRPLFDVIPTRTLHDATCVNNPRPNIREVIANYQRARGRLDREADAIEFDPNEVYRALERVQERYDVFEGAERRPVADHGGYHLRTQRRSSGFSCVRRIRVDVGGQTNSIVGRLSPHTSWKIRHGVPRRLLERDAVLCRFILHLYRPDRVGYLLQDCYRPLPSSWVMVPFPSMHDGELEVVYHARAARSSG